MGAERFSQSLEFIDANLGSSLDVEAIADVACRSISQYSRDFKAAMGVTVWAYVKNRRCIRALEMLNSTQEPVSQIAIDCGFSSQSHLTHTMQQVLCTTPGRVRRSFR